MSGAFNIIACTIILKKAEILFAFWTSATLAERSTSLGLQSQ